MVLNTNPHRLTARDLDEAERSRAGFVAELYQQGYEGRPISFDAACFLWGDGMNWQPVGSDFDAGQQAWAEGVADAAADLTEPQERVTGDCGICERHVELVETGIGGDPPFFPAHTFGVCGPCDHWLRTGEFLSGHEPAADQ